MGNAYIPEGCMDAYEVKVKIDIFKYQEKVKLISQFQRFFQWLIRLYTQYPIIRNASEIWGNFKKQLVSRLNLRNAVKKLRNAH